MIKLCLYGIIENCGDLILLIGFFFDKLKLLINYEI